RRPSGPPPPAPEGAGGGQPSVRGSAAVVQHRHVPADLVGGGGGEMRVPGAGKVGCRREAVGEPAQVVATTGVGGAADQPQVVGGGPHEQQVVPRIGSGHVLEGGQVVA